jgi:CRP-like cAMP-binding protein
MVEQKESLSPVLLFLGIALLLGVVAVGSLFAGYFMLLLLPLVLLVVSIALGANALLGLRPAPALVPAARKAAARMAREPRHEAIAKFLRKADVFQELNSHELRQVAQLTESRHFREGEFLAREGRQGDSLYVLQSGKVRLATREQDMDLTVRVAGPGETLPLASLLEPASLVTTAEAMTDVNALAIPTLKLMELCEMQPGIGHHLYRAVAVVMVQRYRTTLQRLAQMAGAVTGQVPAVREKEPLWD